MANQYFIFKEVPEIGEIFQITDKNSAHHIFTVMRAAIDEELRVVFDNGKLGLVKVTSPENQEVQLLEILEDNTELPVQVTIAVGFPKGDKLDFISEKVTELGASAIWAAPFKWSVAKWDAKKLSKKQEKLSKIILGAAEQSRRQIVPEVRLFDKLTNLTDKFTEFDQILVAYEESAKVGEQAVFAQQLSTLNAGHKILIIFGPEGGISPEEIELFEKLGAKSIGLGPRIMRAETAPLYAISVISSYFELLQ